MTITYTNISTGHTRDVNLTYVGSHKGFHDVWRSENNEHFTKGILGWIHIDKYIKLQQ